MKKIYSLLLLTTIFCATTLATETPTTNKKRIVLSDYDKVWIDKTFFLNSLAQLEPLENLFKSKKPSEQPYSAPSFAESFGGHGKATKDRPAEKKVRKFGNLPLRLLDYGRRYPTFASYIPGLIEYIGKARCFNPSIHDFYKHLKKEGYIIDIATNKDRLSYDFSIEALGNEIPNMVDKVFVAEPPSDETALAQLQAFADKPTTPKKYKDVAHKALTIKETEKIIHVPSKKPALEYFTYVIEKIGPNNDMFFFDDDKENVRIFNTLQNGTPYRRIGILYDKNNLGQFTEDLKKVNLLSETHDKKLLDEIRYPGVFGKIKLTFKSFFEPKNTQTKTAE